MPASCWKHPFAVRTTTNSSSHPNTYCEVWSCYKWNPSWGWGCERIGRHSFRFFDSNCILESFPGQETWPDRTIGGFRLFQIWFIKRWMSGLFKNCKYESNWMYTTTHFVQPNDHQHPFQLFRMYENVIQSQSRTSMPEPKSPSYIELQLPTLSTTWRWHGRLESLVCSELYWLLYFTCENGLWCNKDMGIIVVKTQSCPDWRLWRIAFCGCPWKFFGI